MSEPTAVFSIYEDRDKEIKAILTDVYHALKEKGYNPINQLVGCLLYTSGPCPHCGLTGTWGEAWQINAYDCGSCPYHVTYGNPFLVNWTICPQTGAIYYW